MGEAGRPGYFGRERSKDQGHRDRRAYGAPEYRPVRSEDHQFLGELHPPALMRGLRRVRLVTPMRTRACARDREGAARGHVAGRGGFVPRDDLVPDAVSDDLAGKKPPAWRRILGPCSTANGWRSSTLRSPSRDRG